MKIAAFCAVIYSMAFSLVCFFVIKGKQDCSLKEDDSKSYNKIYVILAAIFIVQLALTRISIGYVSDTYNFVWWTSFGEKYHIWQYYTTDVYVDYPPAYLNVLFIMGKIAHLLGVGSDSDIYLCFVRFVPILFDLLCSIFIFRFAKGRTGGKIAVALALFSAFNPVNILNSTVWGQVDSVVVMLVCGLLLLLYRKKYAFATAVFALAFLTKPQLIIYAPLFGFTILADFFEVVKNREERTKMLKNVGFGVLLGLSVILIVPIAVTGGNYALLAEKYKNALALYPYATLCAPNLYGAFGANWANDSEIFFFFSYKVWGFIFIVVMSLLTGFVIFKSKDRTKIFYSGAFTVLTIFMFAHGMHERYIHALFMILLMIFVLKKDMRVLAIYLIFSVSSFINCTQTLIKAQENSFIYGNNPLFIANSWFNILIYIFTICVFVTSLSGRKAQEVSNKEATEEKER